MEVYLINKEEEKTELDEIYACTREDLILGMMKVLPKGCVFRGSQILAIEAEGNGNNTAVAAVQVRTVSSGQEIWLMSRQLNKDNGFDYVFGTDGVHSLLASRLNPEMTRPSGGATNTVVTCLKDEGLAQQLGGRFIKTYFRNTTIGQCSAFGLLSPSRGVVLGFMQFSTKLHGVAPYDTGKDMRTEIHNFIYNVIKLPSVSRSDDPKHICLIREYLAALSRSNFDHHIWRFVPCCYAEISHGTNCVLLGDALHPMSDFSSQGVSSAIEDAVSLGRRLSTEAVVNGVDTVVSALEGYDSERRDVVSKYIAAGECIKDNFLNSADEGIGTNGHHLRRPFTKNGSSKLLRSKSATIKLNEA
jgi:2-polyprenyl-6-methoxyphenol hydroxylase-like FAD-dependent oxidoreductase